MHDAGRLTSSTHFLDPGAFPEILSRRPSITSERLGWFDATIQRFSLPRRSLSVPAAKEPRLGLNMGSPTQLRAQFGSGQAMTRWVEAGQINLIPAGTSVDWEFRGKLELLLVHVSSNLLKAVASNVYGADLNQVSIPAQLERPDERAHLLARQLLVEAESGPPGTQLFAASIARALCLHMLRRYSSLGPSQLEPQAHFSGSRVSRAIELIRTNLADDLSLGQLAGVTGISASQFGRVFRAETGQTPHHYLVNARVEAACGLLERTALPIIEVALQCGFSQPSHFATTFRRALGVTPREYRTARRG